MTSKLSCSLIETIILFLSRIYYYTKDACQRSRMEDKEGKREDSSRKFRRFNYPLFMAPSLEQALLAKRRNKTGTPYFPSS